MFTGKHALHPKHKAEREHYESQRREGRGGGGHWIQAAIKHKGALHEELGVPEGKKIPEKKLEKAAHKGGVEGKRARLAETLKHLHH